MSWFKWHHGVLFVDTFQNSFHFLQIIWHERIHWNIHSTQTFIFYVFFPVILNDNWQTETFFFQANAKYKQFSSVKCQPTLWQFKKRIVVLNENVKFSRIFQLLSLPKLKTCMSSNTYKCENTIESEYQQVEKLNDFLRGKNLKTFYLSHASNGEDWRH